MTASPRQDPAATRADVEAHLSHLAGRLADCPRAERAGLYMQGAGWFRRVSLTTDEAARVAAALSGLRARYAIEDAALPARRG